MLSLMMNSPSTYKPPRSDMEMMAWFLAGGRYTDSAANHISRYDSTNALWEAPPTTEVVPVVGDLGGQVDHIL